MSTFCGKSFSLIASFNPFSSPWEVDIVGPNSQMRKTEAQKYKWACSRASRSWLAAKPVLEARHPGSTAHDIHHLTYCLISERNLRLGASWSIPNSAAISFMGSFLVTSAGSSFPFNSSSWVLCLSPSYNSYHLLPFPIIICVCFWK